MPGYYLGIDVGTTLITAVLADENWHIVSKASNSALISFTKSVGAVGFTK